MDSENKVQVENHGYAKADPNLPKSSGFLKIHLDDKRCIVYSADKLERILGELKKGNFVSLRFDKGIEEVIYVG